jgi:hypothetical protein
MLETPFWKRAAASLPSGVREQYSLQLQGAERFERRLGRALSGLRSMKAGLARWLDRGGPALKPRGQG